MFKLGALYPEVDGLRLRGLELGFGCRNVRPCGHTGVVAILRELEGFLVTGGRVIEQLHLRVKGAKLEVVDGEFCLEGQATQSDSGGARLCACAVCLDISSNRTEDVQLPGDVEGQRID